MSREFENESFICTNCIDDDGLIRRIERVGTIEICSNCDHEGNYTVTFSTLADWVSEVWKRWYHLSENKLVGYNLHDNPEYEQDGNDAELLIGELIGADEHITQHLIQIMCEGDFHEIKNGGEPTVDESQQYQQLSITAGDLEVKWNSYQSSIKHRQRFFNSSAKSFWDNLFSDLDELRTNNSNFDTLQRSSEQAIRTLTIENCHIYRARKLENIEQLKEFERNPQSNFSNPPPNLAREGRMNPDGISFFYGALDRDTCVAELRPSISEAIVSIEFKLTRNIRIVDFTILEQCYHDNPLSMFDEDYYEQITNRVLIRQLHSRISQPVLPGNEAEYLTTQVMAEFLANEYTPRLDGLIFSSVQHLNGQNLVLFPHAIASGNIIDLDTNQPTESALQVLPDTIRYHKVEQVEYTHKAVYISHGIPEYDGYLENEDLLF